MGSLGASPTPFSCPRLKGSPSLLGPQVSVHRGPSVTSADPALWDLTLRPPLTDTLPPSTAHKPDSATFYVPDARPGPGLPGFPMAKKGQLLSPPALAHLSLQLVKELG